MKTLNEVITIMDGIDQTCTCCAYQHDCDETECVEKTALHYLKVLQKMQKAQPVTKGELDELYNNPLTWDELRTKEGKPVWIEYNIKRKDRTLLAWCLVLIVLDEYMSVQTNAVAFRVNKSEIGTKWQAYRKERNESDR